MPSKAIISSSGILPDSTSRMLNSQEFLIKCEEIRARVLSEFEEEMHCSSFVKRCWLKWQAERLIRVEIKMISPSDYAH
jgi:hypothetical protein